MSAGKLSCWSCTGLGASSREERPASEKEGERGGGGGRGANGRQQQQQQRTNAEPPWLPARNRAASKLSASETLRCP